MQNKKNLIAIDAADLCYDRVDGTRIYIKNVLDQIGKFDQKNRYLIYLKEQLNPQLKFKIYPNYEIKKSKSTFFWTQTRFPLELFKDAPQLLWMPLQTVPFVTLKKLKIVITIHDLAFLFFKKHFKLKDRVLLTKFAKKSILRADRIIAVSKNTKQDILKYFPISEKKIKVIYHGFDKKLFNLEKAINKNKIDQVKAKYKIKGDYLIYVGAIQPRKNIKVLIKAFAFLKNKNQANLKIKNLKLVIAGAKAWLFKDIISKAKKSDFKEDIIFTGYYQTQELPYLLGGAKAFIFPSLYEGFGIPVLEAMACGTPAIVAKNSSLPEVGGKAVEYFKTKDHLDLAKKILKVLEDKDLKKNMTKKGLIQANKFSWEKCAKETCELFFDMLN
jgi:glycosyltransferase involved in cell wall biosynthesis